MASSFVTAPPKRIAQAFRNLIDEFRSFGAAFKSGYDSAVTSQTDKLVKLQESNGPQFTDRMRLAIEGAAKCYYSVRWWEILWPAIKRRFRMQAVACIGVLLFILLMAYIAPGQPSPSEQTYD